MVAFDILRGYLENKANLPPSRKALRPLDYSTETYIPFVHKRNLI